MDIEQANKKMLANFSRLPITPTGIMAPPASSFKPCLIITASCAPHILTKNRVDGWGWKLSVCLQAGQMDDVEYAQGYGHVVPPTLNDVMQCLLMDASGSDQPFEDWAADYGHSDDSRAAEVIYRKCVESRFRLRKAMGEVFQTALDFPDGVEEWCERTYNARNNLPPTYRMHGVMLRRLRG